MPRRKYESMDRIELLREIYRLKQDIRTVKRNLAHKTKKIDELKEGK